MDTYRKIKDTKDRELWHKLRAGNQKAVCSLLDQDHKYQFVLNHTQQTPLEAACSYGLLDVVNKLLEVGANPNSIGQGYPAQKGPTLLRDSTEFRLATTPLVACLRGGALMAKSAKIVESLLQAGADPNQANELRGGETPLMVACSESQRDLLVKIDMLLDAGGNLHQTDRAGQSAIHYAYIRAELLRHLIKKGADVNAQDMEGMTVLHNSVRGDCISAVRTLLANGADPYVINKYNQNAWDLMTAERQHSDKEPPQTTPMENILMDWRRKQLREVAKVARKGLVAPKAGGIRKPKM